MANQIKIKNLDQTFYLETKCRHGIFRYLKKDNTIGRALTTYGEWAEDEIVFIQSLLHKDDVVIDAGANIGTHTIALAQTVGMKGKVYSIEPQPEIFALLNWNVIQNGLTNTVHLMNACVGSDQGQAVFPVLDYSSDFNFGAVRALNNLNDTKNSVIVKQINLDSLTLSRCDFIKLDVEGFEIPALKGAYQLINQFKPIIYAECNSIENGIKIIEHLAAFGYLIFYHQSNAFNPLNFHNSNENIFGLAHESSLLFIMPDRLPDLKPFAHSLFKINSLNEFHELFLNTYRGGDTLFKPLTEKSQFISNWMNSSSSKKTYAVKSNLDDKKLIKSIFIIIPTYNYSEKIESLITFFIKEAPNPIPGVAFLFADDASTDQKILEIFSTHPFFKRIDVFKIRNDEHLGFCKNAASAFSSALSISKNADFIILNPEIQTFPDLFFTLQNTAYFSSNFPSISLFEKNQIEKTIVTWRSDKQLSASFKFANISKINPHSNLQMIDVNSTNFDFCMYIRFDAFKQDQIFNISAKQTQDEEIDWCCNIMSIGFKNISAIKKTPCHINKEFYAYVNHENALKDPLKFHRILFVLQSYKNSLKTTNIHLLTLHSDPDTTFAGGTEMHVRHLRSLLLKEKIFVFILSPMTKEKFVLRGMIESDIILEEFIYKENLQILISLVEIYIDQLHVHHTINWPSAALDTLANSSIKNKIVTIHDFWFLCPSITLLTGENRQQFCAVESDMEKCNNCLKINWHHENETIQSYRDRSQNFLSNFDIILMPSQSLIPYFEKAYYTVWKKISQKINVLSHDLSYLFHIKKNIHDAFKIDSPVIHPMTLSNRKRLCIIGAIHAHKGSQLLIASIPHLQQEGFDIEIFGSIDHVEHPNLKKIKITPYKNIEELFNLFLINSSFDFICHLSICHETFSYTFFEGLLLCPTAIPIVTPYGNPAIVCKENELGVVMSSYSSAALIEALFHAQNLQDKYRKKIKIFINDLYEKTRLDLYIKNYFKTTSPTLKNYAAIKEQRIQFPDLFLSNFSEYESLIMEHRFLTMEHRFLTTEYQDVMLKYAPIIKFYEQNLTTVKIILKLNIILKKHPKIKNFLHLMVKIFLRILKYKRIDKKFIVAQ